MNDFERAICSRVKLFRELIKWSQPAFAKEIGISRDQLANIEYGRCPLRYALGTTICQVFGISGHWLVTGEGEKRGSQPALWVVEFEPQAYFNSTFSEIYLKQPDLFKSQHRVLEEYVKTETPGFDPEAWLMRNVYHWYHNNRFRSKIEAENFARGVSATAERILSMWQDDGMATKVKWSADSFPFIPQNPLDKIPAAIESSSNEIYRLHITSELRKVPSVKSEIQKLLERVRVLVSGKGMKAKLASTLDVPQSRLSEWLGGKCEPSGETTLRLLHWVEQQERQK